MPAFDRVPGLRACHELLLRAALGEGGDAVSAWERWVGAVRIERADAGSTRLLPLVYRNLIDQGVPESDLPGRLKGACRQSWSRVQSLIHAGVRASEEIGRHGIETLLLKGAAMNVAVYRHPGTRPINDVDLRVPRADARRAMEILGSAGWRPCVPEPARLVAFRHAAGFVDDEGRRLNLHWHFLLERCDAESDALLSAQPQTATWQGIPLRVPSAASLLLTACVYGPSAPARPPLRWIADAGTLLRFLRGEREADVLVDQARRLQVVAPVRAALGFLASRLGVEAPAGVLERLHGIPVGRSARFEHWATARSQVLLGCLPALWFSYRRVRPGTPGLSFSRYVQFHFDLPDPGRVPALVAAAGVRRLVRRAP